MKKEKTFEVSWAYGETTFINAVDEAHARRVAVGMGGAMGLGKVLWVLPAQVAKMVDSLVRTRTTFPSKFRATYLSNRRILFTACE